MATIECTYDEFCSAWHMFRDEISKRSNSQDSIGNLWKGLVLHYMGIRDITDEQLERAASMLKVAHYGAIMRGWDLIEPDLERVN